MVGEGGSFGLSSSQVNLTHWIVPALVGTVAIAGMGLAMQQLFLRWNQGQDLRQALITIAVSIILADQMLAHFGGVAEDIAWPRPVWGVMQPLAHDATEVQNFISALRRKIWLG